MLDLRSQKIHSFIIPKSFQKTLNNTEMGMVEMFLGHDHHSFEGSS